MINVPSRKLMLAQIFLIFILPVLVLYIGILPMTSRFFFLVFGSLIIFGIMRKEEWTLKDFGVRKDNYKKGFLPYLFFTLIGSVFIIFFAEFFGLAAPQNNIFFLKTFVFFIPISFLQEFAFRGFLIPRLQMMYKNTFLVVFLNSILFALIHVIYPDIDLGIPVSFIGGIFFAWIYIKYPNLTLISISHAILNITALLSGLFVPLY